MSNKKTSDTINNLLDKLKQKYYPDLEKIKVKLKPSKFLKKIFMISLPFSKNIYYNDKVMQKCSNKILRAAIMHELFHIRQFKRLKRWQKIFFIPKYHIGKKLRIKHELEAHVEVAKMSFGEELIQLNNFVKSRYPEEVWINKWSKYYLSEEKIREIMKKIAG